MLNPAADPDTAKPAGETPAAAAPQGDAKTDPDPDPDANAERGTRDEQGRFKPAAKADGEEAVPAGVQKRIDKAVKAQREAERRADEAEAALAQRTESRPAAVQAAQPAAAAPAGKPESTNFETYEAYIDALTDWKIATAKAADAKTASERSAADANAAKGVAWNARVEAVKKLPGLEDFDEVTTEAGNLPISEAMHVTIFESERGPELAYHLAQHPEEAKRIASLTPLAAARELGKLEAALPDRSAKPAAARPLPKPAANVGGAHAPTEIDLDKADMPAFKRQFAKLLKNKAA